MNPLLEKVNNELRAVGLELELIDAEYDPEMFGNCLCLFQYKSIFLRFIRDRSQDWLEIAPMLAPRSFIYFDAVQVAMGWKTPADVLGRKWPEMEPLEEVVRTLKSHVEELNIAFLASLKPFEKAMWALSSLPRPT